MNNNTIPLEAYYFIAVTAAFLSYVTFKDTTTPDEKGSSSSESIIPVMSPTASPEAEIPVAAEEAPIAEAKVEEEEEPPQEKEGGKRKSKKSKTKKSKTKKSKTKKHKSQKSQKKKRSIKSKKK